MKQKATPPNHNKYDLIVVPGLKFGPKFGMRKDLRLRLQLAAKIYTDNPGVQIAVLGKWSIWYDWWLVNPPKTECWMMKTYLVNRGVKAQDVIMESKSKDTPGNVYYLKRFVRTKPKYQKLLVVCAEQHQKRLKFLFSKFFGSEYSIAFLAVPALRYDKNTTGNEAICLKEQKVLLANVRPGHEEDFRHQLYKNSYYTRQAQAVKRTLQNVS